jgi:cell wall-associated NlpC family hydrolase
VSQPATKFVATNLTDLHAEPSFLSEMLTQVTHGIELKILEQRDKWCRVRQSDGYEGWAYNPFLAAAPAPRVTHLVAAPSAPVYSEPKASSDSLTRLAIGTEIEVVENQDGWSLVQPVGGMLPKGWVESMNLFPQASLPLSPDRARQQMIAYARRMHGVYYLWGGCTAWGIDCSGLAQLVHRLCGYAIPRDTRLQFPAGREVKPPYPPGDLLFFWGDETKKKIGHVGISTGGWKIIHSSRTRNGVYEDDVQAVEHLRTSFAGARSFLKSK